MEKPLDFTPINHLGAQAMTLANQMGNMRAQEQHMRLQGQQEQIGAMQIEKMMKEKQFDESPWQPDIDPAVTAFAGGEAGTQAMTKEWLTKNGYINPETGMGTQESRKRAIAAVKQDYGFLEDISKIKAVTAKNEVIKLNDQIAKEQDPNKKTVLTQQRDAATDRYYTLTKGIDQIGELKATRDNLTSALGSLKENGTFKTLPPVTQSALELAAKTGDKASWDSIIKGMVANTGLTPYQVLSLNQKERFHQDTRLAQDDKEARATRKEQQDLVNRYNAEIANLKREYSRRQASTVPMTPEEWNAAKNDIENRYAPAFEEMKPGWGSGAATGGVVAKASKPTAAKTSQPEGTTKTIGGVTYTVRNGQWVY